MSSEVLNLMESLASSIDSDVPIEGYCWPLSASPGQSIEFFVSASNNYILEYVRLTDLDENGSGTSLVSKGEQPALVQPVPDDAWRDGCGWKATHQLTVPANWHSGFYAARLTSIGEPNAQPVFIVFIVKPRTPIHGDYLLLAHTLTWNAYNTFGGRSRYEPEPGNTFSVSFLRPYDKFISPIKKSEHLVHAELWIIKWMQEEGHNVDVITDQDFHFGIPMQDQYASIILNAHPEYWTQEMVDHLKDYLAVGGCLMNLGGNVMFERVQLDEDGRTLVFFDGDTTPKRERKNYYFRNLNPPQPEREILGVAFLFDNYKSPRAPYEVLLPEHRFFNGTGLEFMSKIGENGIDGAASGLEMDCSRPGLEPPGVAVNAAIFPYGGEPGRDRGLPPSNLQVLARGLNEQHHHLPNEDNDKDDRDYIEGPHFAEMTYYNTEADGFVFSVGSMVFGQSLVMDSNLQKIVNNVMRDTLLIRNKRLPCVIPYVLPLM